MKHYRKGSEVFVRIQAIADFEDGSLRQVDLAPHLGGEVFEPLKDREQLQKRSSQL
jgi:hypothetical protein